MSASKRAAASAPESKTKPRLQQGPVFVRGHLTITVGQGANATALQFPNQNVSLFGVTGLPWGSLDSSQWFGKSVRVQVKLISGPPLFFDCQARVLRESTTVTEHFGLKFTLPPETKRQIESYLQEHGKSPADYNRKYPRIPMDESITTFPVHASARRDGRFQSFVLDIRNISPNGLLLSSENPMALRLVPGEHIDLVLDPRGWFPFQIKMRVLICRITDEWLGEHRNIARMIGVRIMKIEEPDRQAFLDLLRDILSQIQAKQNQTP